MQIFELIHVTGTDAFKFLQSQVTSDLKLLDETPYTLSAYCNRQGRVISVFYIMKDQDDYYLLTVGATADTLINKLKKYSVFSKIKFNKILDNVSLTEIMAKFKISDDILSYIQNKIPVITNLSIEQHLPDNLNLLALQAVSFKKGCFLGQEIIARVYYKGKTKKHLYSLTLNQAVDIGANNNCLTIMHNQTIVGEIIFHYQNQALAVIEDASLTEQANFKILNESQELDCKILSIS